MGYGSVAGLRVARRLHVRTLTGFYEATSYALLLCCAVFWRCSPAGLFAGWNVVKPDPYSGLSIK